MESIIKSQDSSILHANNSSFIYMLLQIWTKIIKEFYMQLIDKEKHQPTTCTLLGWLKVFRIF